jgi:hypothetical protein
MRFPPASAIATLATLLVSAHAAAQRQRDAPLHPTPAGDFLLLDAIVLGAQASYENRTDLEEGMSKVTTRLSGLVATPYLEGSVNVDVNVFLWAFGATAAYQVLYHNHQGLDADGRPDNDALTLERRTDEDAAFREGDLANGLAESQAFPWAEGRAQLVVPMIEATDSPALTAPLLLLNKATVRWEDRDPATFDWFHTTPHDGGVLLKYEGTLFWRHRDFGAAGPSVRLMNVRRDGARANEVHYGYTIVSSPGWQKMDLLLWQMLFAFGNGLFGQHPYQDLISRKLPAFQLLAVYRSMVEL